jgi:hypothetical protein
MKEELLKSLQLDKNNEWDAAHSIVQNLKHPLAYRIHAYLHRKEPDLSNAAYWYSRAGEEMPDYSYEKEWQEIFNFISSKKAF